MADQPLPARDALHALGDLPRYEERLTAKAGGLTSMVWGLVAAALFTTYATASELVDPAGNHWVYAVLWIPWVAAGILVTGCIWGSHALSVRRDPHNGKGLLYSLALTGVFLLVAAATALGVHFLGSADWTMHSIMLLANGLFAGVLGSQQLTRRHPGGAATLSAGLFMVALAFAVGLAGLGDPASALVGSATTAAAWIGAGLATYLKG